MTQYRSHNDLPSNTKAVSINILNARLADAIDLALLTKQAHWNIKGPNFIALHEMIDGFRTELDSHVDTMAERVVLPGARRSARRRWSPGLCLVARYAKVASLARPAIDATQGSGDADKADLFTGFSRALDRQLVPESASSGA